MVRTYTWNSPESERKKIYGEVERAVARGMDIAANIIFIPGYVDVDQVENRGVPF